MEAGFEFEFVDELDAEAIDEDEDAVDAFRLDHFVGQGVVDFFIAQPSSGLAEFEQFTDGGVQVGDHARLLNIVSSGSVFEVRRPERPRTSRRARPRPAEITGTLGTRGAGQGFRVAAVGRVKQASGLNASKGIGQGGGGTIDGASAKGEQAGGPEFAVACGGSFGLAFDAAMEIDGGGDDVGVFYSAQERIKPGGNPVKVQFVHVVGQASHFGRSVALGFERVVVVVGQFGPEFAL